MRRIVVTEFLSLDGVMDNPAWTAAYWNDEDADAAQQRFAILSYSRQRQHTLAVEGAGTPETRQRRIATVIQKLFGGGLKC